MTYEEAERIAIAAGALKPQGLVERAADGWETDQNWFFKWAESPRAQARLQAWTNAVMDGVPAYELRRRIG